MHDLLNQGGEHSTLEISIRAGVIAISAIISELRAQGADIRCRQIRSKQTGGTDLGLPDGEAGAGRDAGGQSMSPPPPKPMSDEPAFTARQIAEALGVTYRSAKRLAAVGWPHREESCPGGTRRLYPLTSLPPDIQAAVLRTRPVCMHDPNTTAEDTNTAEQPSDPAPINKDIGPATDKPPQYDPEALWRWASGRTRRLRDVGASRTAAVAGLEQLLRAGRPLGAAATAAVQSQPFSAPTLKRWHYKAKRYRPEDRAAALIPGWSGSVRRKQIPTAAWDWFTAYYLTRSQPTLAEAYAPNGGSCRRTRLGQTALRADLRQPAQERRLPRHPGLPPRGRRIPGSPLSLPATGPRARSGPVRP